MVERPNYNSSSSLKGGEAANRAAPADQAGGPLQPIVFLTSDEDPKGYDHF